MLIIVGYSHSDLDFLLKWKECEMELHGPFFRVLTAQNTLHTHSHTDGGIWGLGFWVHDDMQAGDSNQRQVICNFSQFNVFFYFLFFFLQFLFHKAFLNQYTAVTFPCHFYTHVCIHLKESPMIHVKGMLQKHLLKAKKKKKIPWITIRLYLRLWLKASWSDSGTTKSLLAGFHFNFKVRCDCL